MSRQYSNRPFVPSRRRVSLQMCEFVPYSSTESNDASVNPTTWSLAEPLSYMHSSTNLVPPVAAAAAAAATTVVSPTSVTSPNDFPYFRCSPHRQTLDASGSGLNREISNNPHLHSFNENNPSCHFHYLGANDVDQNRSPTSFSRITAAASTNASAPHHRHYRLESPSAASFTRHPPWFDDERDENYGILSRPSRSNNTHHHSKRQRSSAVNTPTSQSSQSYHNHHERKRSRQENESLENENLQNSSSENVSQSNQQQYRLSSHQNYQPYPSHRVISTQVPSISRSTHIDHVPSLPRQFEHRSQPMLRNRAEQIVDTHTNSVHYASQHRPLQPPPPPPLPTPQIASMPVPIPATQPISMANSQSRHIYYPPDHRHFLLDAPAVSTSRRQPIQSNSTRTYTSQASNHHQRTGIPFESVTQRAPVFHRSSMTTHMHQRVPPPPPPAASSFLTDLLHRVIDAHAASYSDNHVHHYHHHHPPSASIDLIAYAWMSPSQDMFSLPAAFSIHFGDFFDLTIPDETPVVGLTDTELERLPTMIYTKSCTAIEADDKCAVCLSEYIDGEKLKRLKCKHIFHNDCIDPWLKTSTRCPICRGEQTN